LRLFIERALKRAEVDLSLQHVPSGEECIRYLTRLEKFQDANQYPLPSVVVLDLKMPGLSGYRVLEWIRQRDQLQSIPVVVFSSSDLEQDRQFVLSLGAAAYCVKPMNLGEFIPFVKSLEQYCSAPKQ
jgi:CheY-like chemotaxis protein